MSFTVQVADGEGVVGRYGGSVVLAPGESTVIDAVLALAREAERDHAAEPGRFLPRRVAGLVAASEDAPTVAVISTLSEGLAVLLVGDVSMTLVDASGTSTVSGRDATTWVDTIVRGEWSTLMITLPRAGAVNPRSDLQGGVLTASGVALRRVGHAPAPEAAEPPPTELAPTASAPDQPRGLVLSFDDGSVVTLVSDLVLGREPENADAVRSGAARPLVLDDPDLTMSRVHATVRLHDGAALLVDAGSANGTYTAMPGDQQWTRVGSGQTVPLPPGTKVTLGGRSFVLDLAG